jgi:hypothetical protein
VDGITPPKFGARDELKVVEADVGSIAIFEHKRIPGRNWTMHLLPDQIVLELPVDGVSNIRHLGNLAIEISINETR